MTNYEIQVNKESGDVIINGLNAGTFNEIGLTGLFKGKSNYRKSPKRHWKTLGNSAKAIAWVISEAIQYMER